MSVTLARPVVYGRPTVVGESRVRLVDLFDVPTSLREHAHTVLADVWGPVSYWWQVGECFPGGVRHVLAAYRLRDGGMRYGVVADEGRSRRALLGCTVCADVRPDAGVVGSASGVSVGARCVFPDCSGVYRDAN